MQARAKGQYVVELQEMVEELHLVLGGEQDLRDALQSEVCIPTSYFCVSTTYAIVKMRTTDGSLPMTSPDFGL